MQKNCRSDQSELRSGLKKYPTRPICRHHVFDVTKFFFFPSKACSIASSSSAASSGLPCNMPAPYPPARRSEVVPSINLWPTLLPPTGSLTPELTSSNPKQRIAALTTTITLIHTYKKFITAATKTAPSTQAFTSHATIARTTTSSLLTLLPDLLSTRHPIALAKTARLSGELGACGLGSSALACALKDVVLDSSVDRTSRAAAASALCYTVCFGDAHSITRELCARLSATGVPVAEILAVLRVAVLERPERFLHVWYAGNAALRRVVDDPPVGLHAVRLVHAFFAGLLERSVSDMNVGEGIEGVPLSDTAVGEILHGVVVPAVQSGDQPMQLSAVSALDALQQLRREDTEAWIAVLRGVRALLQSLTRSAIPVRSAALRALGNHPVEFSAIFSVLMETPPKPRLPRAKAFSAAAVLLEQMVLAGDDIAKVTPSVRAAVEHVKEAYVDLPKPEKNADESLRVACLAYLGVALALFGEVDSAYVTGDVHDAFRVVMMAASIGSVNVRVHACKALARVLKDEGFYDSTDIVEFLSELLIPENPVRVLMAAARALVGMRDLSILDNRRKLSIVQRCIICSQPRQGIGDTSARALTQALRKLLGELVVRIVEIGMGWFDGAVDAGKMYDCVAAYYELPSFLKEPFEKGGDRALDAFPEEAKCVVKRLSEVRHM